MNISSENFKLFLFEVLVANWCAQNLDSLRCGWEYLAHWHLYYCTVAL